MEPTQKITHFIKTNSLLQSFVRMTSAGHFWLVGGSIRDLLLGRVPDDIDIACDHDPTALAKAWARNISGSWFWLDKDRCQSRVVTPHGDTYDFSPLRAASIVEDLHLRDFTMNALAFPLLKESAGQGQELLDPLHGYRDLQGRVLRQCHELSFVQDPLRMLKGIRHMVSLGLTIDPEVLQGLKTHHGLIAPVAGERIQTELEAILESDEVQTGVRLLVESSLLESIFACPEYHDAPEALAAAVADFHHYVHTYSGVDAFALVLAYLLSRFEVADVTAIVRNRLKLSKKRQISISQLLGGEISVGAGIVAVHTLSVRQKALVFERVQPAAGEKLVWWNYAQRAVSPEDIADLADAFAAVQCFGKVPHLLSGDDIIALAGSQAGRNIGVLQAALKAAEMTGKIQTREDAIDWLRLQNID